MAKYILLGLVQGLTEFFPVSSSAHLVIMQKLFGLSGQEIALVAVLHLGTLLALVIFFFRDILGLLRNLKLLLLITIVTIITGVIGITGRPVFEGLFSSLIVVSIALMITGIVLIWTMKFINSKRENLTIKDAIILGFAQAIAIVPGISRSGLTISALLFRGIDRKTAFRFSFLASIPAIMGAAILEIGKIDVAFQIQPLNFIAGFVSSFLTGIFALWLLSKAVEKAKLHFFGYYCILLALSVLIFGGVIR